MTSTPKRGRANTQGESVIFTPEALAKSLEALRIISKKATPRNGMTKPDNLDPAIWTLKSSGQTLVGLVNN